MPGGHDSEIVFYNLMWNFMRVARIAFYTGLILISLTCGTVVANEKFLRVGLDLMEGATFKDSDCASTSPAALYGCGTGPDGAPYRSVGDFGVVPAVEFGLVHTDGAKRFEILIEYRPRYKFDGRANFLASHRHQEMSARLSTISGMLAGYVDLTDGVPNTHSSIPFIGIGIGLAHTRIGKSTLDFPATYTTVPGGSHTDLAWMATAGISTELNEHAALEFAWRYTDLGEVRTGRGMGSVTWRDGSQGPNPLNLAPTRARLAGQGVRISLRYSF